MKIGFDVGGVIIRAVEDGEDTSFFSDNYLNTPVAVGAYEALSAVVRRIGSENVFIISKCGETVQRKTLEWFIHNGFYAHTGINPDNVHFCLTREAKTPIAAELGLTHFLDDRADVLKYMNGTVRHLLMFRPEHDGECNHIPARHVQRIKSWKELPERI